MALKQSIRVPTLKENIYLDAWHFCPPGPGPFPVVIAGHGMTLIKDAGYAPFAERWATAAGFASVVFDYRGFGTSGGAPRDVVDLSEQTRDYRSCIEWVRARPELFRADKIVVMGSAMSGLCVAELILSDPALAGGMAHSPLLDGYATLSQTTPNLRLLFWAAVDYVGNILGLPPVYVRAVGHPGEFAFINSLSSYRGFVDMYHRADLRFEDMPNVLAPRLAFQVLSARPGLNLKDAFCPMLVVMAEDDDLIPPFVTRKIVDDAQQRVTLVVSPGGHFDIMPGGKGYETNINAQVKFLQSLA